MTSHIGRVASAVVLCGAVWCGAAVESTGPIVPCEEEGQRIADRGSCTRFHLCRLSDGVFVTDLLICPDDLVYDMVSSSCVESTGGYLQDPAGCTTFYGCHRTRERSEGLVRQHYSCSGDLRFHPLERFCTFKTRVPDDMCNSPNSEQAIIGTDKATRAGAARDKEARSGAAMTPASLGSTSDGSLAINFHGDITSNAQTVSDITELTGTSVDSVRKIIRDTTASMNADGSTDTEDVDFVTGLMRDVPVTSDMEGDTAKASESSWAKDVTGFDATDSIPRTDEYSEESNTNPDLTQVTAVIKHQLMASAEHDFGEATNITPTMFGTSDTPSPNYVTNDHPNYLTKQQLHHLTNRQPYHSTNEHLLQLTNEQHHQLTNEQHHQLANEQLHHSSDKQPQSLTNEQPHRLTNEQPHGLTYEQPQSLTNEQPYRLTNEQPHGLTDEQPHRLTSEQPHTLTNEKPHRFINEQPYTLTNERPQRLIGEQHRDDAEQPEKAIIQEVDMAPDIKQMPYDNEKSKEKGSEEMLELSPDVYTTFGMTPVKSLAEDTTYDDGESPYDLGTVTMTFKYDSSAENTDPSTDEDTDETELDVDQEKHTTTMKSKLLDILLTNKNNAPEISHEKLNGNSPYNWGTGSDFSSYDMATLEHVNGPSPFTMNIM